MPAKKKDLEIRIKISKADERAANAVIKQLNQVRDAARQVATALNAIGAAKFDTRRMSELASSMGKISSAVKNFNASNVAAISKLAKSLQELRAINKKDVDRIRELSTAINNLTKVASKAAIQTLSTQLLELNKSIGEIVKASKSIGNVKTILENISKVRFASTSASLGNYVKKILAVSEAVLKNRDLLTEATKLLRGFKNAVGQAFDPSKLAGFKQSLESIVRLLAAAVKGTSYISGPALGTSGPLAPALPPTPPPLPPKQPTTQQTGGITGGPTDKELQKTAAALEKVTAKIAKINAEAETLNSKAVVLQNLGRGSEALANRMSTLSQRFSEAKEQGKVLSSVFKGLETRAQQLGIEVGAIRSSFLTTAVATKNTIGKTNELSVAMQRLATVMKFPQTFSQLLAQGFDKIAASQIKFLAASLLMYRGLQSIVEEFRKILEVSDRTAKAFAVSRSSVTLFEERYRELGSVIENTTAVTGRSINEVSEILFQFGSAGLQAEESMAALDSTLNLIIATDANVTLTTKTVAATYRLLGDTLDDVGGKTEKFARINDVIAATYRDNQVEINELTQAYKFAIPVAKQLRLSFEETTGIIATLQNNMIRAGEAGRSLRAIFSRVASQADKFAAAFGVAIDPTKPLDFLDLLEQVNARMKEGTLTADQVGTVFERLGLRGANSFLILTKNIDDVHKAIRRLETDSQGAAEEMANIRLESISGQVAIFSEGISKLVREGLKPLMAVIAIVVKGFVLFQKAVIDSYVYKFVTALSALLAILLTLKLIVISVTLVQGALSAAKLKQAEIAVLNTAAVEAETAALLENAAANGVDLAATEANAQAKANLAAATVANTGKISSFASAVVAILAKLAIYAAIIAAIIALFYALTHVHEILNWWSKKTLDNLTKDVKERRRQIDAIDESIKRVKEFADAYRYGLATVQDVTNAIAEAGEKHESLAVAAALSGDNIEEFLKLAEQQRQILKDIADAKNVERMEEFEKVLARDTDKLRGYVERAQESKIVLKELSDIVASGNALTSRQEALWNSTQRTLGFYVERIREARAETSIFLDKNKDLIPENTKAVKTFFDLAKSILLSSGKSKKLSDAFVALRVQARSIQDIDFSKQIDQLVELGGASQKGLEGLAKAALFEFKIPFPKQELENVQNRIKEEIAKIEDIEIAVKLGGLDLYDEIAKNIQGVEFEIDATKIKEQGEFLGSAFINSIKNQLAGAEFTPFLQFKTEEGEMFNVQDFVDAVSAQAYYAKLGNEQLSWALENLDDIYNKSKSIYDVESSIVDRINESADARREQLITQEKGEDALKNLEADRARAIKAVNDLFSDTVRLYNQILLAQGKANIAAEEFLFIAATMDSVLLSHGQINEDQLAVQDRQNLILRQQFDQQKENYDLAKEALKNVYENIDAYTDAASQIENMYKATEQLSSTTEDYAGGLLKALRIAERINISWTKSTLALNDLNLGIESGTASLRTQLAEVRAISGIQALIRGKIEKTNKMLLESLGIDEQLAELRKEELGSAGNLTEIAALHKESKAKQLELERRIVEEVRKSEEALRDSRQQLEAVRAGESDILSLRNKISNSLGEEERLQSKIADKTKAKSILEEEYAKTQAILNESTEKIARAEQKYGKDSLRVKRLMIREETKLAGIYRQDISLQRDINKLNDDLTETNTELTKQITERVLAQRDLVATTYDYRDSIYDTLQAFEDIRIKIYETLNLEKSREVRQSKLNRLALDFLRVQNKRRQISKEIEALSGTDLENSKISQEYMKRIHETSVDYADVLQRILEEHKQIVDEMEKQELDIAERLSSIYEKQLGLLGQISDKIRGTLTEEISFVFEKRPFTEMINAASLLGMSLLDIERIGTDETIARLARGFADGSISADNFTGKMREAVSALRELNIQQQRLIEAQNKLQEARYELGIQKFSRAFVAGDFDEALKALGEMENASEILNATTGETDIGKSLGRFIATAEAGEMLAEAMKKSKIESKDSFDVYARAQTLLKSIEEITSGIFANIGGTQFDVEFLKKLEEVESKFRSISGITQQIARFETAPPEIQELNQATLELKGGIEFSTEEAQDALYEFVFTLDDLKEDIADSKLPSTIDGLDISVRNAKEAIDTVGETLANNPIVFTSQEVAEALGGIEFTSQEVAEAFNTIEFTSQEVAEALGGIEFTSQEVAEALGGIEFTSQEVAEALNEVVFSSEEVAEALSAIEFSPEEVNEALNAIEFTSQEVADAFNGVEFTVNEVNAAFSDLKDIEVEHAAEIKRIIGELKELNVVAPGQEERVATQLGLEGLKEELSIWRKDQEETNRIIKVLVEEKIVAPSEITIKINELQLKGLREELKIWGLEGETEEARVAGYQMGGFVPGIGRGDIIPAMLEPGEYVIPRDVVEALGVGFFNNLVSREEAGYKHGGIVGMQEGGVVEEPVTTISPMGFIDRNLIALSESLDYLRFVIKEKISQDDNNLKITGALMREFEYNMALQQVEAVTEAPVFQAGGELDLERLSVEDPELVKAISDIISVVKDYNVAEERTVLLTEERAAQLRDILNTNQALADEMNNLNEDLQFLRQTSGDTTRANANLIQLVNRSVADIPDFRVAGGVEEGELTWVGENVAKSISDSLGQGVSSDVIVIQSSRIKIEGVTEVPERIAGYQMGGFVGGVGRGDIIPAMLEPGEFVVPRNIVNKLGVGFFDKLVAQTQRYRYGGIVKMQGGGRPEEQAATTSEMGFLDRSIIALTNAVDYLHTVISTKISQDETNLKVTGSLLREVEYNTAQLQLEKATEAPIFQPGGELDLERISLENPELVAAISDIVSVINDYNTSEERTVLLTEERAEQLRYVLTEYQGLANAMNGLNEDLQFLRESSGDTSRANLELFQLINKSVAEGVPDFVIAGGVQEDQLIQVSNSMAESFSDALEQGVSSDVVVIRAAKVDLEDVIEVPERVAGYQGGGMVPGVGTGDKIPALLEPGEFVIPKKVVEALGADFFENARHMRTGGLVSPARYQLGTPAGGAAAVFGDIGDTDIIIDILGDINKGIKEQKKEFTKHISEVVKKLSEMLTTDKKTVEATTNEAGVSAAVSAEAMTDIANSAAAVNTNTSETASNLSKAAAESYNYAKAIDEAADGKKEVTKAQYEELWLEQHISDSKDEATEKTIRQAEAWDKLFSQLKGGGKGSIDAVVGIFSKFQSQISSANSGIKQLTKTILGPFKNAITGVLKSLGEEFKDLFANTIPGLISSFVSGVLIANAEVEADYRRSLADIQDSYKDQRVDLVEQLKRNEISYFDYFNKLEDLQADSADQRNSIEDDRLRAMEENINNTFGQIAQAFSGLITDIVGQFSGFFDSVIDKAVGMLESLEPVFETVASGIGVAIETAIGVGGGATLAGALGGALGLAGGPAGAGIGLAIGAGVGGVLGEIFTSIVPIVGDIAKVFKDILTSMVEGAAQLIPVIIDLATLPQEEFASLFGGVFTRTTIDPITGEQIEEAVTIPFEESVVGTLPDMIAKMGEQLIERLAIIGDKIPDIVPRIADAFLELIAPSEANAKSVITAVADTMIAIMPTIATELLKVLNSLAASLPGIFEGIFDSLIEAMRDILEDPNKIEDTIKNVIDSVVDIVKIASEKIPQAFIDNSDEIEQIAPDIIKALAEGIAASATALSDAAISMIKTFTSILTNPDVVQALASAALTLFKAAFEIIMTALKELVPGFEQWLSYIKLVAFAILAVSALINTIWIPAIIALGIVFGPVIVVMAIVAGLFIAVGTAIGFLIDALQGAVVTFALTLAKLIFIEPIVKLFDSLKKTFEAFMAALKSDPRFIAAMEKMNDAFGKIQESISDIAGIEGEGAVIDWLLDALVALIPLIVAFVEIITALANVVNGFLDAMKEMQQIIRWVTDAILGINHALWGGSLGPDLLKLLDVIVMFTNPLDVLTKAFETLISMVTDLANFFQQTLFGVFSSLIEGLTPIVDLLSGLPSTPAELPEAAGQAVGGLVETGKDIYNATLGQVFGTLHSGGVFPTDLDTTNVRALAADEGIAVLRRDEGILTRAGVEAIGGPTAVDAANAGSDIFTAIPPSALSAGDEGNAFGEVATGFGAEPAGFAENTGNEETTIKVDVTFDNCQFNGEDVADVVESNIAEKMQNRDGVVYKEIKKQKTGGNPGIRKR